MAIIDAGMDDMADMPPMPDDMQPIMLEPMPMSPVEATMAQLEQWAQSRNIAADMPADMLRDIGSKVVKEYQIDETSRAPWKERAERALRKAKLTRETKNYPFDGASNVKYPLLTVAALQFASRAYPAIVDGQRIVKGQVVGADPTGLKRSRAERISRHMSWQLTDEMPDWEADTDWLLHQLPILGCAFRKVWHDPISMRHRSEMVSALDLVVNAKTRDMTTVPRISQVFHLYPHEIAEAVAEGDFREHRYDKAGASDDEDEPCEYIEQYRLIDLDEDGLREPYVVTVNKDTEEVARIVANYNPRKIIVGPNGIARIPRISRFVKYSFFRDPEGGFYDLGFGELLESPSDVIDSTINQMMDAGHLQNAGGGFIGSGVRLKKGELRMAPGKYHMVEASGVELRNSIYNFEHPGPSPVLFNLLGMMVESGKEIASIKDILSGELPRNQTATTTLAMIEQGMKVYTAIYKRVYGSLKQEFKLLFDLNTEHLDPTRYNAVLDDELAVAPEDYNPDSVDVCPVADPNIVTDAQRLTRAQVYMEVATNPAAAAAGVDPQECMRRFFDAIGADEVDKLFVPPPQPGPVDELQARGMTAEVEGKEAETQLKKIEASMADDQAAALFGAEFEQKLLALMQEEDELREQAEPPDDMGAMPPA